MSLYVIGVDPGITGGVALVGPNALTYIGGFHMPVMRKAGTGSGKNVVDPVELHRKLDELADTCPAGRDPSAYRVAFERVQSMPRDSSVSAFSFGHAAGSAEAVLRLWCPSLSLVTPSQWKRGMSLSSDKGQSLAMARDRFGPRKEFEYVTKTGIAEAALLAAYWLKHNRV
jgi:crossover junction endodeoxyribonuclease RuvC